MTTAQKVIKYCAIALAAILILSLAVGAIRLIALFEGFGDSALTEDTVELFSNGELTELDKLDIDIAAVSLEIKQGDRLSVSTNSKYITCEYKNGSLTVKEGGHSSWLGIHNTETGELTVTLPEEFTLKNAEINTGAGVIGIADICAKTVDFEFGAGAVTLSNIKAEAARIDGGAGKITVDSSVLCDLELHMGVGELSMKAAVLGNSKIDCGVGKVDLTLVGDPDDYRLKITRGLGSADVEGLISDGDSYGNGQNFVEINGGVGSITVEFSNY